MVHSKILNVYVLFCLTLVWVAALCTAAKPVDCAKSIHFAVNGTDDAACLQGNGSCKTLHYAFTNCTITNSTQFLIGPGTFSLTQDLGSIYTTAFSWLEGLVVKGSGAEETTIDCSNASGLAFVNMTNLTISDLTLFNCSQSRPSTSIGNVTELYTVPFQVGLYIWRCTDVVIENVHICETIGVGLVLYETGGRVSINSSVFHHNGIPENMADTLYGGGGVNVEFPYCPPGYYDDDAECGKEFSGAEYTFYYCTFTNNTARLNSKYDTQFITPYHSIHQSFGRGGGMAIYFSGNSLNNTINVSACTFIGNQASFGGGLFCEFHDRAQTNTFIVNYSFFILNSCYNSTKADGGGGGGARFAFLLYDETDSIAGNEIYVGDCIFTSNTALFGGGISFLTGREQNVAEASNQFRIDSCFFGQNVARIGSAVCLLPWSLVSTGVHPTVEARRCSFESNSVNYSHEHLFMQGIGTLYSYAVQFYAEDNNTFANNNGSGIVVVGTGVTFKQGVHRFQYNYAGHGGGIAVFAGGWVTLHNGSELRFENNRAAAKGGAVYSESSGGHQILASRDCVFRYYDWRKGVSDWDCILYFMNNTANEGGNDIYVSSVYPCIWGSSGGSVNDSLSDREKVFQPPLWKAFTYADGDDSGSILTGASNVSTRDQINITTFPGQLVNLYACCKFNPVDDFNQSVTVPFYATVIGNNVNDTNQSIIKVASDYTYMERDISFVRQPGVEEEEDVTHRVELRTLSDPIMVFHFDVTITACPPGTHYVASEQLTTFYNRCDCSPHNSSGYLPGIVCNSDGNKIQLSRENYYWVGHLPQHQVVASGDCPYCSIVSGLIWDVPLNLTSLEKGVCLPFHEGVLCGSCTHGVILSSISPTFECGSKECNDTSASAWALWICLQLFLSTLVVGTVLLLDFNVVGGALCSFVFFNQITLSLNLNFCGCDEKGILQYVLIPYDIWSLQFGRLIPDSLNQSFCVSQLHSPLEALALDYIFAVYPFILIVIVWALAYCHDKGWCCRCCHSLCVRLNQAFYKFRQLLAQRTSLVHGIATCLVLTYGKLATISLHILTPGHLNLPVGSTDDKGGLTRAYFNGNWIYFDHPHAYYGVLAIVVMLAGVILPPLFLFSYPVLPQVMAKCSSKLANKLNRFYNRRPVFHLLSIFQGHYKAKYYFYAGMWFIYRLALYFNDAFNTEYYTVYFVQILCGVTFLLLHALMQPCRDKRHFVIDCLLFTNIVVLSCLAQLGGHIGEQPGLQPEYYVAAIAILLILPYAFFFGVLIYRIVSKVRGKLCNKDGERQDLLGSSSSQRRHRDGSISYLVHAGGDDDGDEWLREGLIDSQLHPETSSDGKGRQCSKQDDTPLVSSVTVEALPVHPRRIHN